MTATTASVWTACAEPALHLGGEGLDELALEGSAAPERFEVERRGGRVRVSRDVGHVRAELDDVERVATRALGGRDTFTAGDLRGTDVNDLDLDLGADGAVDPVVSLGSDEAEFATVFGGVSGLFVLGMPAFLRIGDADATDELTLATLGGDDRVNASGPLEVTVDGGAGDDALAGGAGAETLIGRTGDDASAVAGAAGTLDVTGLPARVRATRAEGAFDRLEIDGGPGADTPDDSGLAAGVVGLLLND